MQLEFNSSRFVFFNKNNFTDIKQILLYILRILTETDKQLWNPNLNRDYQYCTFILKILELVSSTMLKNLIFLRDPIYTCFKPVLRDKDIPGFQPCPRSRHRR